MNGEGMEEGKRREGERNSVLMVSFLSLVQLLWSQGILLSGLGSQALGSTETQVMKWLSENPWPW